MAWTTHLRSAVATALMVGMIAIGAVSATHAHVEMGASGSDHCATCRVVHSAALTPAAVTPLRSVSIVERIETPHCRVAAAPRIAASAPRGPPSLLL